jgi:hypothetical protein
MIIAKPTISDLATVTGAATSGTMTVGNLKAPQPRDRTRFSSLTGMYCQWDLLAAHLITLIWFGYSNASSAATVRTRAGNTSLAALLTSPSVDRTESFWCSPTLNTSVWERRHYFKYTEAGESYRYWRFDFEDASNPDGFLEIGRGYLDEAWKSSVGAAFGFAGGTKEEPVRLVTEGGQVFPFPQARNQAQSFQLYGLTKTEAMVDYTEISRLRGVSQDVLVWQDETDLEYAMHNSCYGLISDVYTLSLDTRTPTESVYLLKLEAEEMP